MKKLAIIIPTYNRKEKLFHTLFMLHTQDLSRDLYEIIVIDDGSSDGTEKDLKKWIKEFQFEVKYFKQKNQKQGAARNLGISKTKADYVLLLGDDMIPLKRDFLKIHYKALEKSDQKTAFLGFVTWHTKIMPNRFLYWLEHGGPQFNYKGLRNKQESDFWHFYTANISLPRKLLLKEKFDTNFKGYGYEDIELAYRLVKNEKLKIVFLNNIPVGHDHELKEKDFFKRIPEMKKAAEYFEKKHSELNVLPKGFKLKLIWFCTRSPFLFLAKILHKEWWWYLSFKRKLLFK